jgi:hypothetical protein
LSSFLRWPSETPRDSLSIKWTHCKMPYILGHSLLL